MSIRLTLSPPINPELVTRIRIYQSLHENGHYTVIADLNARVNGEFVSVYEVKNGRKDHWYKVGYLGLDSLSISSYRLLQRRQPDGNTESFMFPAGTVVQNGSKVYLGSDSTQEIFESHHGVLPLNALYFYAPTLFRHPYIDNTAYTLRSNLQLEISGFEIKQEDNTYIYMFWAPCEIKTDPVRACSIMPIKISYSIPRLPADWQVSTIYIKRSDKIDGDYDTVSELTEKSDFHNWKTEYVDLGGSDQFFYKVAFGFSRWDDSVCRSVFSISPDSDPVTPVVIDGTTVAKIVLASPIIDDMRTSEALTFKTYPYCGYHRFSPADVFMGGAGSPYSRPNDMAVGSDCGGGNTTFGSPMNVYDNNVQRQLMLLEATGENVILLRRKWTGTTCPCVGKIDQHPTKQCPTCFGSGFVGGFDRVYFNESADNPEGRILIRFQPAIVDLNLKKEAGFDVMNEPSAWTIPQPIVRDRDIIVQYDPIDRDREIWRYEILDVTRNAFFGGVSGAQIMRLKRCNKYNDIAYSVPLNGEFYTDRWDNQASLYNSFGRTTMQKDKLITDTTRVTLSYNDARDLAAAYSRKIWPFLRTDSYPDASYIRTFIPRNDVLVFASLGEKPVMELLTDVTINNHDILQYSNIELESALHRDHLIILRYASVVPTIFSKTLTLTAHETSDFSEANVVEFTASGKIYAEQTRPVKSLLIVFLNRAENLLA